MKAKYLIRETSVLCSPSLFFAGFARGGGVTMVFGPEHAARYETKEASNNLLTQVKERSGRDGWIVEMKQEIA